MNWEEERITESLDVIRFLEDYQIDYKDSGTNVGKNDVNIKCPFPHCADPSFHCGINLEYGYFHCWICDSSGPFPELIQELLDVSLKEARRIAWKYGYGNGRTKKELLSESGESVLQLPPYTFKVTDEHSFPLKQQAINYLISRDVPKEFWDNIYFSFYGKYFGRIIFPIYFNSELVNFVGRAFLPNIEPRYVNCPNEQAKIPLKNLLYNYDNVVENSFIILVEGIFDSFAFPLNHVVALFGKSISDRQTLHLLAKKPTKVFVVLDAEARADATKMVNYLSSFVDAIPVYLKEGDPNSLSPLDRQHVLDYIMERV